MVHDRIRVSGLCFSAANISFKFFESRFNLPSGAVVFNNFLNRQSQIGRKKGYPLGFAIDPYNFDRTLERFEHHDTIIGHNGSDAAIKIDVIFACKVFVFYGQ